GYDSWVGRAARGRNPGPRAGVGGWKARSARSRLAPPARAARSQSDGPFATIDRAGCRDQPERRPGGRDARAESIEDRLGGGRRRRRDGWDALRDHEQRDPPEWTGSDR